METKSYSGKSFCKDHGEFSWSGIYQEMNTVVVFKGRKTINCGHIFKRGSKIIAETECPICHVVYEKDIDTIQEAPTHV